MGNILIVVDMQNDFIDGALGTEEAKAIVPYVKEVVSQFDGTVIFTRDTHFEDYLNTQEGTLLPVSHCIKGTPGWELHPSLLPYCTSDPIDKPAFGSNELPERLKLEQDMESITFLGLCTDVCVISNAMIAKAFFPEIPVYVDAKGCAGITPESHRNALEAMKMCQIHVLNDSSTL